MIPRFILSTLLALFAVLIVTFAVLMGGYGIASAVGDAAGARALWWIAMSCVILLVSDCLLLLAALAITCLDQSRTEKQPESEDDDPHQSGSGAR